MYNNIVMNRTFDFSIGEYYHGYNRGVDKRIIFLDKQDHERFVKLLYICNSKNRFDFDDVFIKDQKIELKDIERGERLVAIGAWCLMPNHFHLLMKENLEVRPPNGNSLYGGPASLKLKITNKHFLNY
jgi:putative transposase